MLTKIMQTVKAIMTVIIKINSGFDKERCQLKKLEKALNQLGNPGYCFQDGKEFFEEEDSNWWHYLSFDHGQIIVVEIGYHQDSESKKNLSEMSLGMVDAMLERLPSFLESYQKFLEETEETNAMTLDKLTKIVEAITAILAK